MWPFRKKQESTPYRWTVEAKLERQVTEAVQREMWKHIGPILAAQQQAMQSATARGVWAQMRAVQPCPRCHQHHPPMTGDCLAGMINTARTTLGIVGLT